MLSKELIRKNIEHFIHPAISTEKGESMDEVEKLATILGVLDYYWKKMTSDLSTEQLLLLKEELSELETKIKSSENITDINAAAKQFFDNFPNIGPLEYLANIKEQKMRGGDLPKVDEEIRIKIINYCVTLQDKIETIPDKGA